MFFEKDKNFFLFSCVYFKTVSFILKMSDRIPMTFGEIRTFHSDWYGEHEFPWTSDLYEHQGDDGPFECPGMANNWKDFVKITEDLYGST